MNPDSSHRFRGFCLAAPLWLACTLVATGADSAVNPPQKTHTLFMGSDISVVAKDTALPVRDVENGSFVVNGPGGRTLVRADDPKFRLKLDDALKLAATSVTVDKLVFERVFSAGKDPMQKFADSARAGAYMTGGVDATDAAVRNSEAQLGHASAGLAGLPADTHPEARASWEVLVAHGQAMVSQAQTDSSGAQALNQMQTFSTVGNSDTMSGELADAQYDALNVSFDLSTPRPLDKPYVVIFMRYLAQKDRPETANVWVYAQRLPLLDEHPRKFNVRHMGFPPGYHIDSYHVHIYDNGTEVATTASRKQVALTTAEAFDYTVLEYIGNNRDQTKAPLKAKAFWPADLSSRLVPDKLSRTLYVKVNKEGHALGLFDDEICAKPVADADIAALTPELCFLPALQKGKPVVSVAPIRLGNVN